MAAGHSSSQAHTIIEDLAQGGADLEATDREGRTPLLFALEGNRKEAIDALLHAGAPGLPSICFAQTTPSLSSKTGHVVSAAGKLDRPLGLCILPAQEGDLSWYQVWVQPSRCL